MRQKFLIFSLSLFLSFQLSAVMINNTAVSECEQDYQTCLHIGYTSTNSTAYQNSFAFCSADFNECLDKNAYIVTVKPKDCYLADAEWEGVRLTIISAASLFFSGFLLFPASLKFVASMINRLNGVKSQYEWIPDKKIQAASSGNSPMANSAAAVSVNDVDISSASGMGASRGIFKRFLTYDPEKSTQLGKRVVRYSDVDGDGIIEGGELLQPTIGKLMFFGIGGPGIGYVFQGALRQQAKCDYGMAQKPGE